MKRRWSVRRSRLKQNETLSKMEELSIILESKQSELDQKDELVKKVGEFNETVDKLKIELSETKEERDRLEERIEELEQESREKYEFESQRSGTPPGKSLKNSKHGQLLISDGRLLMFQIRWQTR